MKKSLVLAGLFVMLLPFTVFASEAGPYLIGEWGLNDTFQDGTTPVTIADTALTFINPTPRSQVLEYAFFDDDGGFCGCDRDFPASNAVTRYTMSAENAGGMFICNGTTKPLKTHGVVKSIVFERGNNVNIVPGSAMTVGFQTHFFAGGRTESDMKSISYSNVILNEMRSVHRLCVDFCNANPTVCPPLP